MNIQNAAAKQVEAILGHDDRKVITQTDISNPDRDGGKYADPSGEKMKALIWMGKNDVRVRTYYFNPINEEQLTRPANRGGQQTRTRRKPRRSCSRNRHHRLRKRRAPATWRDHPNRIRRRPGPRVLRRRRGRWQCSQRPESRRPRCEQLLCFVRPVQVLSTEAHYGVR